MNASEASAGYGPADPRRSPGICVWELEPRPPDATGNVGFVLLTFAHERPAESPPRRARPGVPSRARAYASVNFVNRQTAGNARKPRKSAIPGSNQMVGSRRNRPWLNRMVGDRRKSSFHGMVDRAGDFTSRYRALFINILWRQQAEYCSPFCSIPRDHCERPTGVDAHFYSTIFTASGERELRFSLDVNLR